MQQQASRAIYGCMWPTWETAEQLCVGVAEHCGCLKITNPTAAMRCVSMFGRNAAHCNTLQHIATYCHTLQRAATHWSTLQYTATLCDTLQLTQCHMYEWVMPHI